MHAAYEQVMSDYKNDSTVLIASAVCETSSHEPSTGSSLCKAQNTSYYPHLAYGDPSNLKECQLPFLPQDITYQDLKDFIEKNKPGADANSAPSPLEPLSRDFICPATSSVVV